MRKHALALLVGAAAFGLAGTASAQFQVRVVNESGLAGGGFDNIDEAEAVLANPAATEAANTTADTLNFGGGTFPGGVTEQFALSATGMIDIINGQSISGAVLYVNSDDGFRIRLNGTIVSEFVGPTGNSNTASGPLTLSDGDVIQVTFFEASGGEFLRLRLNDDNGPFIGDPASGIDVVPIPEPAALGLLGIGGLGLLARRRRAM